MKKIIIITWLLLILVASVSFLVVPSYQKLMRLDAEIAKKQADYDSKIEYYSKMVKLKQEIDARQELLSKIDSALPTENSYAGLMDFLQTTSLQNNLTVKSMNFSVTSKGGPSVSSKNQPAKTIKNMVVAMNVSGSYQDIKNFLETLDNSVRLFQVNSISFAPLAIARELNAKATTANRDVSLELQTYNY